MVLKFIREKSVEIKLIGIDLIMDLKVFLMPIDFGMTFSKNNICINYAEEAKNEKFKKVVVLLFDTTLMALLSLTLGHALHLRY
jgi:hypothetical protein